MIRSIVLVIVIAIGTFLLISAQRKNSISKMERKSCRGYSVIEVDKGIDCYGDTIKLVKVNGFFERASEQPPL